MSNPQFIVAMLVLLAGALFAVAAPSLWRWAKRFRLNEFFSYRSGHGRHSVAAIAGQFY